MKGAAELVNEQSKPVDLHIECRNVELTPRWKEEIEARIADLQAKFHDIVHARVTLTKNTHHKKARNVAEAVVVVTMPGRHTLTARKERKTFEEAMRAAFHGVEIELRRYREKQRPPREIRIPPVPPYHGVISRIFPEAGYGFILRDGGGEIYFHRNAVHGMKFEELEDGVEVVFNIEEGEKGPQATTVNPPPVLP